MRIFAALPLPEQTQVLLAAAARALKMSFPGLSTVNQEALHLTLLFFGEQPEETVLRLSAALDTPELCVSRIDVSLGDYGQFPPRGRPRVIFCGLRQGASEVSTFHRLLHSVVGRKMSDFQNFLQDNKSISPHITLARNRRGLSGDFFAALPKVAETFTLDRLVLYRSDLKQNGAEYTVLKTIIFKNSSEGADARG
jgi:2'-5' RNA ligase